MFITIGIITMSALFLFGVPSIFIFPYTLGKKFDRIMEKHNFSLPASFDIMPPYVYRTNMYAFNICLPNPKMHPRFMKYYKRWFGNFWFRAHASTWDKIQAWYIVITAGIFIITAIIFALMSLIS